MIDSQLENFLFSDCHCDVDVNFDGFDQTNNVQLIYLNLDFCSELNDDFYDNKQCFQLTYSAKNKQSLLYIFLLNSK